MESYHGLQKDRTGNSGQSGRRENIVSAAHCATRLRLVIADNSKADKTAIENVEGVKDLIRICTGAEGRCVARP